MRRVAWPVATISSLILLLPAAGAFAAPTKMTQWATVNLDAAKDGTVNDIVVTYGPPKSNPEGGPPMWGHYISDTAGILNLTDPEGHACLTEDATHDFCPDGTSVGEPGAGSDFKVFLNDGDDNFTATTSIGGFEVHAGGGDDVLKGSGAATYTPGFGTPPQTYYNGDELYGDGGNDHIFGDLGGDFLYGGAGNDVLHGGKMATDDDVAVNRPDDTFSGGPGNDLILADDGDRDNRIDCGPGRHDVAVIDRIDPTPTNCETVRVR